MSAAIRVRFSEKEKQCIVNKVTEYYQMLDTLCIDMFLSKKNTYVIVDESEPADICIVGIQHVDNSLLRSHEMNIFLTVENLSVGRGHYKHFNHFGRDKNPMIRYYIYNDISSPIRLTNGSLALPCVYYRIRHFLCGRPIDDKCPFEKKKFCLFTSRNFMNEKKRHAIEQLTARFGKVDFLQEYDHLLKHRSCYEDAELLKVYNQYKFIICFENSNTNGYITEKIFNVFLSGSIPIYDGAPDVGDFINKNAFLGFDDKLEQKVRLLLNHPTLYDAIVNARKIVETVDTSSLDLYF